MRRLFGVLLAAAVLTGGCKKDSKAAAAETAARNPYAGDLPAVEDLSAFAGQAHDYKARLLDQFLTCGFVVSIGAGGAPAEQGDSALFTGLTLAMLSCDEGQPLVDGLVASIHREHGMVPRWCEPRGPDQDSRPTSRDMVLGVMVGLTERAKRCPDDRPAIEAAWAEHYAYVNDHGGDLGPGTGNDLGALTWLWQRVSQELHARSDAATNKGAFEAGQGATAESIKLFKTACYPMHLGFWQMWLAQRLGSPVSWQTRKSYCNAAADMDLPLTDWYCERKPAAAWLPTYVPDQWQYRHQRCGAWDQPDGGGEQSPAVDWLDEYWVAGTVDP